MRRFSPELIEQIRMANDIVDIISEDVFLKRSGARYMGLCPFPSHNEKTPSFSVSLDQQLYHCFGCGASGNIYTYLQEKKGLHFVDAVKALAERAGIPLPRQQTESDPKYLEKRKMLGINLLACQFYERNLLALRAEHPVKKYLKKRQFSDETIKEFHLGYAGSSWEGLLSHLKKENASLEIATRLGLIRRKESHYYDLFRDRLIFPIFSKNGKEVLGFGARALGDALPKYINSNDSEIFHKGKTFYGWDKSSYFIRDSGKAILVEGYTDFISLYQRGVKNVVASLGTALTPDHARWLSWHVEQVILFFDGDQAGKKAARRSLNFLLSAGLVSKILKLGEKWDPDSFICEFGKKALDEKVKNSQDLFLQILLTELEKHSVGVDRFSLIEKMAGFLAQTKKTALKEYYQKRLLDVFGSDEKIARKILEEAIRKKKQTLRNSPYQGEESLSEEEGKKSAAENQDVKKLAIHLAPKSELFLLVFALENPDNYQKVLDAHVLEKLTHPSIAQTFKKMEELVGEKLEYFDTLQELLAPYLSEPRLVRKKTHPFLSELSPQKIEIFIQDCVNKVEKERKRLHLKKLRTYLHLDKDNSEKYLKQIVELTKKSQKDSEMKYDG